MTRTIIAIGTALLTATTFFASAAEACISCNYVPEVVHTPVGGSAAKRAPKQRTYVASKEQAARPAKKRIAKAAPVAKKQIVAKAAPVKKETVVAKAAPVKKETVAKAEPVSKAVEAAPVETQTEERSAPISVASVLESQGMSTEEPKAEEADVGCKKFFPAVGMTLTVPCE